MEPILLNFFDNEINAQEIKQKLSDVDIECVLQNEQKTIINSLSDSVEEGVAVYVDKKDYPEAKEILDNYEKELEEKLKWCPECDSEDITVSTQYVKYKPARIIGSSIVMAIVCCVVTIRIHNGDITLPGIIGGFVGALIGALVGGLIGKKGYEKTTYHCNKCGHVF